MSLFDDMMKETVELQASAGRQLSESISQGLFDLTGGEVGQASPARLEKIQNAKIAGFQADFATSLKGGKVSYIDAYSKLLSQMTSIGADTTEVEKALGTFSTQAEKESLQARRLAAGRESEKSLAESQRQFDLEQQRLEKAASDAAAAKVEAAEVKAATDAAKKQVALQKARPSEAKVDDNIMKLISGAEGLKDIVDDSGKIPDDVKFGEGNRDSLQLFYKEAFLAGVPEADIQDAIQKSIGYIANGDDGGWLGWAKDTLTFDIEQAKTLIAGLGTDSGIEAQLGAE